MSHDEHGERLARIEAGVQGINDRLDRLNGQVDEHGVAIGKIQARCAAHDMMSIGGSKDGLALDLWRAGVDENLRSLEKTRDEATGAAGGVLKVGQFIIILITLGLSMWSVSLATQAAHQRTAEAPSHQQVR